MPRFLGTTWGLPPILCARWVSMQKELYVFIYIYEGMNIAWSCIGLDVNVGDRRDYAGVDLSLFIVLDVLLIIHFLSILSVQNWGEYMTECTFNWRMMKTIFTELHVYDEVRLMIRHRQRTTMMGDVIHDGVHILFLRWWWYRDVNDW